MSDPVKFNITRLATFYADIRQDLIILNEKFGDLETKSNDEISKIIFNHIKGNERLIDIFKEYEEHFPHCESIEHIRKIRENIERMKDFEFSPQCWDFCDFLIDLFEQIRIFYIKLFESVKDMDSRYN